MNPQTDQGRKIQNHVIWSIFLVAVFVMFGGLYYMVQTTRANVTALQTNQILMNLQYEGAVLETNFGNIEVEFLTEKAPQTVKNFTDLAADNYFDNTRFHRVIEDFMIQGGDPLTKDPEKVAEWGTGGPGYQIQSEINDEPLVRGVLAMANRGLNTGGSQFFIVTAEATPWLDGKHTAFAKVTNGMDVVMRIQSLETGARDVPAEPVIVNKVTLK